MYVLQKLQGEQMVHFYKKLKTGQNLQQLQLNFPEAESLQY